MRRSKIANGNLSQAKKARKDEFYTTWNLIEKEIQAYLDYDPDVFRGKTILCPCDDPEWSNFTKYFALHFQEFGLKKLISTSYAVESKLFKDGYQTTLFETNNQKYNAVKTRIHGKIFILEHKDINEDGVINIDDLDWEYMKEDGDFRSDEVKRLREEADIIVTNPPFSLFREFLAWIVEADKQFLIIGNMNSVTYKEVFPLIMENKMWYGPSISSGDRKFYVPKGFPLEAASCGYDSDGQPYIKVKGVRWFTNLDHGRRHQPLPLMTMGDNLKFNKQLMGKEYYDHYDNYEAIEVPYTNAIPSDYDGVMGVPISFLDKYCPDQFDIIGLSRYTKTQGMSKEFVEAYYQSGQTGQISEGHPDLCYYDQNNKPVVPFMRILIRKAQDQ